MAYMRGDHYIWSDGECIHIWVKDGYDGWDQCYEGEEEGTRLAGWENASGVSLRKEVMDEFVVMRLAQLMLSGTVAAAIDRVVAPGGRGGNIGEIVLRQNAEMLKEALRQVRLKEPEPLGVAPTLEGQHDAPND